MKHDALHYWIVINPANWESKKTPQCHGARHDIAPMPRTNVAYKPKCSTHCVTHNMPVIDNWSRPHVAQFLLKLSSGY